MSIKTQKNKVDLKFKVLLNILYSYIEQNPRSEITVFKGKRFPFIYFDSTKNKRICEHEEYLQTNKLN